jgi:hypothetical protein
MRQMIEKVIPFQPLIGPYLVPEFVIATDRGANIYSAGNMLAAELEQMGFPSVRTSCCCHKLNSVTKAFVEAAQGSAPGRKLLAEVKLLRSTGVEGSGKWGYYAAEHGSHKTAVPALAPPRWDFFSRTGCDILQMSPLPTDYVEEHGPWLRGSHRIPGRLVLRSA